MVGCSSSLLRRALLQVQPATQERRPHRDSKEQEGRQEKGEGRRRAHSNSLELDSNSPAVRIVYKNCNKQKGLKLTRTLSNSTRTPQKSGMYTKNKQKGLELTRTLSNSTRTPRKSGMYAKNAINRRVSNSLECSRTRLELPGSPECIQKMQ